MRTGTYTHALLPFHFQLHCCGARPAGAGRLAGGALVGAPPEWRTESVDVVFVLAEGSIGWSNGLVKSFTAGAAGTGAAVAALDEPAALGR